MARSKSAPCWYTYGQHRRCSGVDAEEYITFLHIMLKTMTKVDEKCVRTVTKDLLRAGTGSNELRIVASDSALLPLTGWYAYTLMMATAPQAQCLTLTACLLRVRPPRLGRSTV